MTNFSGKNLNVAGDGPKCGGMDSRRNALDQVIPEGYKQTEVGVIPDDWGVSSFDDISSLIGDGIHTTPNYDENGDFYFVNGNNLVNGSISLDGNTKKTNLTEYKKHKKPLDQKTLLLSINGTIGNVAEYNNESIVLGKSAAFINVKKGTEKKYIFYVLGSHRTKLSFFDGLTGSTIKNLGLGTIRTTLLPLPPEKEQIAIANALSDVDALLTELEKLIAKKQAIKTASMQQLLTGKTRLPQFATYTEEEWQARHKHSSGTNVNVGACDDGSKSGGMDSRRKGTKTSELGEIPEDWDVVSFGELFEQSISRKSLKADVTTTFVGMQDVSESAHLIKQTPVNISKVKSGFTYFERSDVLVAKITPCFENGKGCHTKQLATVHGFGSTEFHVLRAKLNADSDFIYFWTTREIFRQELESEMVGSAGHRRVPFSALQNYKIPCPNSKDEQTAIATILLDMDNEIQTLEKRLAKTRQIKQGMMQELLTGRTRLPFNKDKEA